MIRRSKKITGSTKARSEPIKANYGSLISKGKDKLEKWFHVVTGVRQGCIIFPFSPPLPSTGSCWIKEEGLSDQDFADDIAALSVTTQGLQCLVESVGRYTDVLGLVISEKKTKHMLTGEHQLSTDVLINHNKVKTSPTLVVPSTTNESSITN